MPQLHSPIDPLGTDAPQAALERVVRALAGIRYGSVEIVVHDGRIVQIERKEKVRFGVSNDRRANG